MSENEKQYTEIKTGHCICTNCESENVLDLPEYDIYICLDEMKIWDEVLLKSVMLNEEDA